MNTVEKKQGEASVEWLFKVLQRARIEVLSEEGAPPAEQAGDNEIVDEPAEDAPPPTVEMLLGKSKDPTATERMKEIMRFCEALPNVERYTTEHHIVYRTSKAFAKIYPQQFQFWVDVLRKGVDDPDHLLLHQHPIHGHIKVPNDLDLDKVKGLIKQSYDSTVS
jgi:predicted transport protein